MPSFDYDDDFLTACRLSRQVFPAVDISTASQSRSAWDGSVITIKDEGGKILLSHSSIPFGDYMRSRGRIRTGENLEEKTKKANPYTRYSHSPGFSPLGNSSSLGSAAEARSMVSFITSISLALSWIVAVASIVAFFAISIRIDFGAGAIVLIAGLFVSFTGHFTIRFANIGLEILADIASDLRVIRLRSQDTTK